MAKWYYYNEQGDKIEVTGGQLKGLAKAGMITPDTIVETEEGKSAPARKVKGLTFIAAAQTEPISVSTLPRQQAARLQPSRPPIDIDENTLRTTVQEDIRNPFAANSTERNESVHAPAQVVHLTTPPKVLPAAESSGSSWQVTLISAALILVVGGIGYKILDMFDGRDEKTTKEKEEVVIIATPNAVQEIPQVPPEPPKPAPDPRLEQLVISNFNLRIRPRERSDLPFLYARVEFRVQNNTGKAIKSFEIVVDIREKGSERTVQLSRSVGYRFNIIRGIEAGEIKLCQGEHSVSVGLSPILKSGNEQTITVRNIQFYDDEFIGKHSRSDDNENFRID